LPEKDLTPPLDEPESLPVNEVTDEAMLDNVEPSFSPSAAEAAASVSSESEISPPYEHLFASWNRKLHSKRSLQAIPVRSESIPTPHLKTLRAIFEGSSKVSYCTFENLWFHLNGENSIKSSKKGTSHRRLLSSDGKVVGGTFALKGGKRQYSDKPLKELRDALTLVGYGQNYLSLF